MKKEGRKKKKVTGEDTERERVKCVLMWVVRKKRKKKKNDYLKKRECIIDNMMYVFL